MKPATSRGIKTWDQRMKEKAERKAFQAQKKEAADAARAKRKEEHERRAKKKQQKEENRQRTGEGLYKPEITNPNHRQASQEQGVQEAKGSQDGVTSRYLVIHNTYIICPSNPIVSKARHVRPLPSRRGDRVHVRLHRRQLSRLSLLHRAPRQTRRRRRRARSLRPLLPPLARDTLGRRHLGGADPTSSMASFAARSLARVSLVAATCDDVSPHGGVERVGSLRRLRDVRVGQSLRSIGPPPPAPGTTARRS